jgi:tetratricopeptide (TPR) repeat protein
VRSIVLMAACLVLIGAGCNLPDPETVPRALVTRRDSVADSIARVKGPIWRAEHYPYADLHGPFPRPHLADSADTNDPLAYYQLGDSLRYLHPGIADRAFYWATRLDPTFADAYFARWRLLRRDGTRREMPDGSIRDIFRVKLGMGAVTDSLLAIAIAYSPFLDGAFDVPLSIVNMSENMAGRDPTLAGLRAFGLRDYRKAVAEWSKAIKKDPTQAMLHIPRAHAWVRLKELDSAIADLTQLAQRLETVARDSVVKAYLSKEFLYYAIGMLHGTRGRYPEARAAFEQSLAENLGFYMAHVRLSGTLVALQDTATALSELETAILIRPDDPLVLVYEGNLLVSTGRIAEGEKRIREALRADSDYALPHVFLGLAAEARHDTTAARAEYAEYVARAPRSAEERQWAANKLTALARRD